MSSNRKWTDDKLQEAVRILRNHTRLDGALKEIGESRDALGSAFRRHNLDPPTSYLKHPDERNDILNVPESRERDLVSESEFNKCEKIVAVNDFHIPFHNRNAVKSWLAFCEEESPEYVIINGDFLDCFSISSFPKRPNGPQLQEEIDIGIKILEELREVCPDAEIHFLEGNHEERLERLVKEKDGLYDLKAIKVSNLLELDRFDIEYHAYMEGLDIGDLTIVHGDKVRKHSAYSAKGTILDDGYKNVVIGHTHRMGWFMQDGYTGRKRGLENGGLFDKKLIEYDRGPTNWQNGFCIAYQNKELDFIHLNPIEMTDEGQFVWKGDIYGVDN